MKKLLASLVLAAGLQALADEAKADCGSLEIAEMNWASAAVIAQIDKIILEKGFGCEVELVPGDTLPTFDAMNGGKGPDVAPEFWVNSVRLELDRAVSEGRLVIGAETLADGAVEGWWIPKFVADSNPDIKTVQQALNHPELFPAKEQEKRGAIHNCPVGWSCHVTTANLFRAFHAEAKSFILIQPASAAELDRSIAEAFEKKQGWLGYHWAPTPTLGKYEMVKLSFGTPHDREDWARCTTVPECPNPKVNSYPTSQVFTLLSRRLADKGGPAADYLKMRQWTNSTANQVLAWKDEKKATSAEAARHFLDTMPEIWMKWVSPSVSERVKARL